MEAILWTLIIFFARVLDVGLGTIRVQFIMRRQKLLAAATGFVEILIFILVVSRVIQDIQNWPYVLAYACGFATGTLLGMTISEKLSKRMLHATVIYHGSLDTVEAGLRSEGFALTRYEGVGRDGPVHVLDVVCVSDGLGRLTELVTRLEPRAFLFSQELNGLHGGYIYGLKSKV